MAKFQFGVVGRRGFPLDMLKKSESYPATQLDVNEIIESYKAKRPDNEPPFVVVLEGSKKPELAVWKKSGWTLVTADEGRTLRRLSHI